MKLVLSQINPPRRGQRASELKVSVPAVAIGTARAMRALYIQLGSPKREPIRHLSAEALAKRVPLLPHVRQKW